ncbi:MAG: FtsX-like permease family protein [Clostridiales bacterium]|nr:FtsX-like permease family protein [Clostridiales bacterium]
MNPIETIKMAFKAIWANKVRSFLTMLGVIIGVMSVTVLMGIGQGTTSSVTDSIASMGTNMLSVTIQTRRVGFGGPNRNNRSAGARGTVILKTEDVLSLKDNEYIQYVSPTVSGSLTAKAGSTNTTASIMGVYPDYASIVNTELASGRYIMDADVSNRSAVCIVGQELAMDLFGNTNVVGNTLHVDGRKFRIVGVLDTENTQLIMPFTLAQRMLDSTSITSFYVSATDSTTVGRAEGAVSSFLYKKYQNDSTYSIMNQEQILETMEEMTGILTTMLGGIAGISLLVGGIGIMNIMLVSVTERTREIGIRKAIGAKRRNILLQFLIESVVLSGMGGVLGLLLGYVTMKVFESYFGMEVAATVEVAQLALGFSMFVGIVFGLYPANKASKLKPIDALHYS